MVQVTCNVWRGQACLLVFIFYLFIYFSLNTTEPSDAAKRSGGILDGSGGGAKVTPLTKGLGFIVTHVCRYVGEKNMCIQEGRTLINDNGENLRLR